MKKQLLLILLLFPVIVFAKQGNIVIEKNVDPRLIGTWASECLTPNPEDDSWSERHTFVFNSNNTATHTRISFDKSNCMGGSNMNLVNSYRYKTFKNVIEGSDPRKAEGGGLIDLIGSPPLYDIYVVMGNVLMMGHGFRNNTTTCGAMSPTSRCSSLNTYIVYKKLGR